MNLQKYDLLIKIDRMAAWVLLFSILIYLFTGYGMTKGIVDSSVASLLHKDILPLITFVSFSAHTFLAIRIFLLRNRWWNIVSKLLLSLTYIFLFSSLFYLEVFYNANKISNSKTTLEITKIEDQNKDSSKYLVDVKEIESKSVENVFTLSELAKYNGKNGNQAYVAVDGVVYDLSTIFKNGIHFEHFAGEELTNAFYKKHAKSEIIKYPVVGVLQTE